MSCNELRRMLLDYLDGLLETPGFEEVEAHLSVCRSCRRLVDEHQATWRMLDLLDDVGVPSGLRHRLLEIPSVERHAGPRVSRGTLRWLALAAAVLLAVFLAWQGGLFQGGAAVPSAVATPDDAIIAQLDLIENLDFLQQHAVELDAHRELALLELLEPYGGADDVPGKESGDYR